jgi:hypothetical protein
VEFGEALNLSGAPDDATATATATADATADATAPKTADADADVRPFRRAAAPSRWRNGRVMLLAASLAGVAFLPWAVARSRGGAVEPYALVRQLDVEGAVARPTDPWAVTRGSGAVMSERGRAVRLGARLVDLELAIAAGDSGMRRSTALSIDTLAHADPPLTGAPAELYQAIAAGDVADRAARREGWEALSELAGEQATRLGAWLEAARVAAARQDAEFFRSRATRGVLDDAVAAKDEDERTAMVRVRTAVASGSPEWASLATALEEALRVAGR